MERKNFTAELKAVDERGRGTAVISSMGVIDADGDIVEPGAFGRQRVVFLRGHDWQSFPLGHAEVHEAGDKAIANLELNLSSSEGRDAYEWLKFDHARGGLQEFSYGFSIVQPDGAEVQRLGDGRTVRRLKKLRLHEVSMVVKGAGVGTRLVSIKADENLAAVASFRETQRKWEQFLAAQAVKEFERISERAREDRERPFGFVFLPKGTYPEIERGVTRFASWASQDIGISTPTVRLFREARAGEASDFRLGCKAIGVAFPGPFPMIAVAGSLSPENLAETVAHEVMHAAGGDEAAADAFGRKFLATTYRKMGGGGTRAGRPMPGMTQDQTPVIVSYQPIS